MIPMELFTMGLSAVIGGLMTIWGKSIEAKNEHMRRLVTLRDQERKAVHEARKFGVGTGFQYTRRALALSAMFAIIVWPKIVPVFWPEIAVTVGWTAIEPGFWFFTDAKDVVEWKSHKGLVLTPLDTHLMSAVVGLYFGASMVKNAR